MNSKGFLHIDPSATFILQSSQDLGAVEVATFIALVLCGVSLSQGYVYFNTRNDDSIRFKALVGIILFFEISHSFTAAQTIFYDTVTKYTTVQPNSFPLATTVLIETLITIGVQFFFSYRIAKFSKSYVMASICLALSMTRFIGGLALTVLCYMDVPNTPNGVTFVFRFSWLITSALAVGGAADVLIALSMSYYLRLFLSSTNRKSTSMVLNRLIRWSLQTGLLTSLASVAVIICFQTMQNMIWFGIYVMLAKFYVNSLLVSLNTRPKTSVLHVETTGRSRGHSTAIQFERPTPQISVSHFSNDSDGVVKYNARLAADTVRSIDIVPYPVHHKSVDSENVSN